MNRSIRYFIQTSFCLSFKKQKSLLALFRGHQGSHLTSSSSPKQPARENLFNSTGGPARWEIEDHPHGRAFRTHLGRGEIRSTASMEFTSLLPPTKLSARQHTRSGIFSSTVRQVVWKARKILGVRLSIYHPGCCEIRSTASMEFTLLSYVPF